MHHDEDEYLWVQRAMNGVTSQEDEEEKAMKETDSNDHEFAEVSTGMFGGFNKNAVVIGGATVAVGCETVVKGVHALSLGNTNILPVRLIYLNITDFINLSPTKVGIQMGDNYKFYGKDSVAMDNNLDAHRIISKNNFEEIREVAEIAAHRYVNNCANKTLCMEKLSLVLPETPPYVPRQFGRCAVIGNSGDLLKAKFGKEIDGYDAILRENGAPIDNYTEHVGKKSTFRLLNRGSAKALDKVAELYETGKEVLIVKTTIHDIMNKMIREIPILNPVYLMLGASFGSAAKGTGLKALEFALSICDTVDMYGFTVDPGYKEWTRYFSESRQGHTPLQGRAYYQMMECLGLIKIHSPMRSGPNHVVKWVPSQSTITAARLASKKMLRWVGAGSDDPLASCSIIKMKLHKSRFPSLRKAAIDHQKYVKETTMYPLEHSVGHSQLCTVSNS